MKFRVERDVFADAVAWAARSLPVRPSSPVLAGLLIEASDAGLVLSTFDYETSARATLSAEVNDEGKALVSGRLLADIVQHPAFAPEEIERWRRQTLSSLQVAYSDPEYVRNVVGQRVAYGEHPYAFPTDGFPNTVPSLTRDDELATITVTVKAVNHRFLDLQLRMPPSLAAAESRIRSLAQSRVARGRLEISVSLQQRRAAGVDIELNEPFLDALKAALERARERGYLDGQLSATDLLRFPQAMTIRDRTEDSSEESPVVAKVEVEMLRHFF